MKKLLIVVFVLMLSVFVVNLEDNQNSFTQDAYALETVQAMGEPWCC